MHSWFPALRSGARPQRSSTTPTCRKKGKKGKGKKDSSFPDDEEDGSSRRGGKKTDKGASSNSLEFMSVEEIQGTLKQAMPSLTGKLTWDVTLGGGIRLSFEDKNEATAGRFKSVVEDNLASVLSDVPLCCAEVDDLLEEIAAMLSKPLQKQYLDVVQQTLQSGAGGVDTRKQREALEREIK